MKVLFVYPEMPETCWTMQKEIELGGFDAIFPPLGLLTVAAMLPEQWEKKLVDLNIEKLSDKDIEWADFVFLGGMNVQEVSARQIIKKCKDLNATIVAGGTLFTHEYERFPEVDYFVLNEAEITLPLFLNDLENGILKRIYQTKEYADVHITPTPLWGLAKMEKYASVLIQYSRGCPYMCDFCDVTVLFGRRPRTKTSEQIITELDSIPNINSFGLVFFADDNLIGNKKELKKNLLPELALWQEKREEKVWFMTQLTINLADDDVMMQQMLDAGFGSIFIGIETPDEKTLIACRKKQNAKRSMIDNVKYLQESGFEVMAGMIVGFDTDEPDIFDRQIEFLQESGIVLSILGMLNAPPGTELFDKMKAQNRLVNHTWYFEGATNIIPKMDPELLFSGFNKVVSYLYGSEGFYIRTRKFLSTYKVPEVHKNSKFVFRFSMIKILFKALYTLGIKDENRIHFWKLFFWTIKNRPDIWDWSIKTCARGRHFRMIYKDNIAKNTLILHQLKQSQNITDIDNKVINKVQEIVA